FWGPPQYEMRRLITALVLLVGAFALIGAPSAFADTFTWSYSSGTDLGSGTFTATNLGGGVELITGITGTWDGSAITGLLAPGNFPTPNTNNGTCCEVPGNNNLLYYPGSPSL